MRPFSSMMYLLRNIKRSTAIMLVLSLVTVCFLAGMYINSPLYTALIELERPNAYLMVKSKSGNNDLLDKYHEFVDHADDYKNSEIDTIINVYESGFEYTSSMTFNMQSISIFFESNDDLQLYRTRTDAYPEDFELKEGEAVVSEMLAKNWGVKVGDVLDEDFDNLWISGAPLKIAHISKGEGIFFYAVDPNYSNNSTLMYLRSEGVSDEEASRAINELTSKIRNDHPEVSFIQREEYSREFKDSLSFMVFILYFIVALVSLVIAITINALFAAAYDKRKYEFSVYKALGFSNLKIFGKVAGEVLIINAAALVVGGICCSIALMMLQSVLEPKGMGFVRFSPEGMLAMIISDLLVVIPVILFNWKRVRKYDVTVF